MLRKLVETLDAAAPAPVVEAHCDGPCGVYDPASARIAAEAVLSMTTKILALVYEHGTDLNGDGDTVDEVFQVLSNTGPQ